MRQNPTRGESAFQLLITHLKIDMEFAPQAQVAGYILDFYHCGLRKDGKRCQPFCVEVDGASHNSAKARAHDKVRTAVLARMGIRVIRFTNKQVAEQRAQVALAVMQMREGV